MNNFVNQSAIVLLLLVFNLASAQGTLSDLQDWTSQAESWHEEYEELYSALVRRSLRESQLERGGEYIFEAKSDLELREMAFPLWNDLEELLSHPGEPSLNQSLEEIYPEYWNAADYYSRAMDDASTWVGWVLETDFDLTEYREISQVTDKYNLYLAIADLYERLAQEVAP